MAVSRRCWTLLETSFWRAVSLSSVMPLKGSASGARGLAATNLAALLFPSGFWFEDGGAMMSCVLLIIIIIICSS